MDELFMDEALKLAREAFDDGEVPVGCVIVRGEEIVGRGRNRREKDKSALAHAELEAIADACKNLGGWRLWECTLYVTLEPCPMCAGAIVQARLDRVVIGTMNPKAGCAGSILNVLQEPRFNHQTEVTRGILQEECSTMLKSFFKELRKRLKEEREK
jgi:tRNA(adenine34) deaminase